MYYMGWMGEKQRERREISDPLILHFDFNSIPIPFFPPPFLQTDRQTDISKPNPL